MTYKTFHRYYDRKLLLILLDEFKSNYLREDDMSCKAGTIIQTDRQTNIFETIVLDVLETIQKDKSRKRIEKTSNLPFTIRRNCVFFFCSSYWFRLDNSSLGGFSYYRRCYALHFFLLGNYINNKSNN